MQYRVAVLVFSSYYYSTPNYCFVGVVSFAMAVVSALTKRTQDDFDGQHARQPESYHSSNLPLQVQSPDLGHLLFPSGISKRGSISATNEGIRTEITLYKSLHMLIGSKSIKIPVGVIHPEELVHSPRFLSYTCAQQQGTTVIMTDQMP